MFIPPLRELLGDACVVEEPRFPEADVNVFVEVGRLESEWVGARATPAIPDLVKLGTDIGGVSMMAFKHSFRIFTGNKSNKITHRESSSQQPRWQLISDPWRLMA